MKEVKKMRVLIIEAVVGAVIAVIGWNIDIDYYMSLVFACGFGLSFSSIVQIIRLIYWNSPKHEQEYEARKQEAHINAVDERRQHIRERTGYVTYVVMAITLPVLSFVLALFHVEAWIIGMVLLIFLFQCVVWTIVFRRIERRM